MPSRILLERRFLWAAITWGIVASGMVVSEYLSTKMAVRDRQWTAKKQLDYAESAIWTAVSAEKHHGYLNEETAHALADAMRTALDLSCVRLTSPDRRTIASVGETQLLDTAQKLDLGKYDDELTSDTLASTHASPIADDSRSNPEGPRGAIGAYTLEVAIDVSWVREDIQQEWLEFGVYSLLWVTLIVVTCASEHYRQTLKALREELGVVYPVHSSSALR